MTEPSPWYCLTVRVLPPRKVSGFGNATAKARAQATKGTEGRRGMLLAQTGLPAQR